MKINLTVVLTLMLLVLMVGAGCTSGIWAYALGHQALKSVTQPDAVPTSKFRGRKGASLQQKPVEMVKEEDILTTVNARIQGKGKKPKPVKPQNQNKELSKNETPAENNRVAEVEDSQPGFPITTQNQRVTLKVLSARYSGGALLVKVKFKNENTKAVRFLYSFLNVTDDHGRALSANTEGMPAELPPNGETISGTMSISTALLDNVKKLSMTLTDYPDQQLQLQMPEIPVKS